MIKKTILVTGGLGFIGSNFLNYFLPKYPEYLIVNADALTYAANPSNLESIDNNSNYVFQHIDIRDRESIYNLFAEYQFSGIIHFAAESHVDNSINNPSIFAETNILGTLNLLEAARKLWLETPFTFKDKFTNSRFHHISTDEVFGTLGDTGYFTEETPYAPNSPYSASKASSDMLVRSYYHTFGLNVITTNCSNNYGPMQHDEKFIPTIIRNALTDNKIPIYGDGNNVRDWLYVDDHCCAIDKVFHQGKSGETYLIGGNNERTNIEIANTICQYLEEMQPKDNKSYKSLISFVSDRPGHDLRYAIDSRKIEKELKFLPKDTFETGLIKTINWYLEKYKGVDVNDK
jgi:dTDP-glucose 4,6-dehydratase